MAVRFVAPAAYVATAIPKKVGRRPVARQSQRRIKATSTYHDAAQAIDKGRSSCVARALRDMANYPETPASK